MMVSTLTCSCLAMSLYLVRASCCRFLRMVMSMVSSFCLPMLVFCSILLFISSLLSCFVWLLGFWFVYDECVSYEVDLFALGFFCNDGG